MDDFSLFGAPRDVVERVLDQNRRHVVACPICGREPVRFATDPHGFHLARCPRCHLEYHSPRPSLDDIAKYIYTANYHSIEERNASSGQTRHFARQLASLRRAVNGAGQLLDVGAGAGAFLRFARQHGWHVTGADIVLSAHAKDAADVLFEGHLADIDFGNRRFDAIRFNQVLEHTSDPVDELRRARGLLRDSGVVLVAVPNLGGASARIKSVQSRLRIKRHAWRHYAALHHLWFFTPDTLARVCVAAGYRVLSWETPAEASSRPSVAARLLAAFKLGSVLEMYATPHD